MDKKPKPTQVGKTKPDDVVLDASPNAPHTHEGAKARQEKAKGKG